MNAIAGSKTEPKVYRASRFNGGLCLLFTLFFVGFGVMLIIIEAPEGLGISVVIFILVGIWASANYLLMRVVVDGQGLTIYYFGWVSRSAWEAVDSWSSAAYEDGGRVVLLCVRGRWSRLYVHEAFVCRPGFGQFVEDIRGHAGAKESID